MGGDFYRWENAGGSKLENVDMMSCSREVHMRTQDSEGRKLKVRWSAEEWTPAIRFVASKQRARAQRPGLPDGALRRITLRKRKQVLWVRGNQFNTTGLTGLNRPRTTWR